MFASRLSGAILFIVSISLLFSQPGLAIYQDEAYSIDFAHTLVGTPIRRNTFFLRPSSASRASLLYTLGEKGVIGAINPRDGEVVWRALVNDTILDKEQQGQGILRAHESSTTVVSGFGSVVRAWDSKDGRLVWEWASEDKVKSLEVLGLDAGQCDVVVLTEGSKSGGTVYRVSGTEGTLQWKQPLAQSDYPFAVSASPTGLFITSLSPASRGGYKVRVQTLNSATGKESSQYLLSSENEISSEASLRHISGASTAPVLVWTDEKVKNVHINVLGQKHTTIAMASPSGADAAADISVAETSSVGAVPHFLLQYGREEDHRAEVYHVDISAGKASKAYDLPRIGGRGTFSATSNGKEVFFVRQTESETLLVSSTSKDTLKSWPVKNSPASVAPGHSISDLIAKPNNDFSVRTAVVTEDGDWQLYQNGQHTWTRYEGLSGVVAAAFVEIPMEESLVDVLSAESHSNALTAYLHRVQRHVKDLKYLPAWLQSIPARFISGLTGIDIAESSSPVAYDSFGIKKIIVVATQQGRLAALASANQGQVLWSIQAARLQSGESWNVNKIDVQGTRLYVLGAEGEFWILNAITGKLVQHSPRSQGVSYYVPLGDKDGNRTLLAITQDGIPSTLPDGFPENARIVTQRTDGTVAGWKPTANGKTALVWTFAAKTDETVTSVSMRPAHDPVASIGRARGDRNVLYKFLSPNLALVTASSVVLSTLSVYLLDTISGQVLYSTTHTGVDTAAVIPATMSENWFAYSVFTDVPRDVAAESTSPLSPVKAHQLIISELFESPLPNNRGSLGSATNYSSTRDLYMPYVQSAAYVIPGAITALGTSSTLQGITPRSLLAYSPALAGLVALPVPYLSPRRPVGRDPTQAEREEGLTPYQAHLDFAPTWFLSHKRELLGINGILSTPTNMESTSVVFAYGDIDLFGTRVAPIGMFDVLGKGFGKLQLIMTVLALAIGTSFLAPMARRKSIDILWGT